MIRIIKRAEPSKKQENLMRAAAVVCALIAAALIMAMIGYNPFVVYATMIRGSLSSFYRFSETINKTIPLVTLSLGIAVAFKMKFWNIGAEGQMLMGAFGAALIAFYCKGLPMPITLILMFVCAFLFGGMWALIPGILKSKIGASETLVTLMLNYIALSFISFLQYGPWKDPKAFGFPKIANFPDAAVMPKVFGIHCGWIVALVLVIVVHIMLTRSKLGYEITVLGESETTARYAGMNVTKILLIAILISGGLCGAAGMMQASAIERSINDQMTGGLGFTAVITTWLSGLSAPALVVVSFLFAILLQGGSFLQTALQIPAATADIIQGIILFFVLGSEFFIRYRFISTRKASKKEVEA